MVTLSTVSHLPISSSLAYYQICMTDQQKLDGSNLRTWILLQLTFRVASQYLESVDLCIVSTPYFAKPLECH